MSVTLVGATGAVQEDPRGNSLGQDPFATREGARRARYAEYEAFYSGEQWLGNPLPGEKRLTFNYARVLVRKAISYLFAGAVTWGIVDEVGDEIAAAAEAALLAIADHNDLARLDFATAVDAAVLGDGAFKVTWDEGAKLPRVTAVDPAQLSVWWDLDDPSRVHRVIQRVTMTSTEARDRYGWQSRAVATSEIGATFVVVLEEWTAARLVVKVAGDTVLDTANPFGELPYVVFPNEPRPQEFWGESDLVDIMAVGRELNQRMTTVSAVLRLSGAPIAVIEGVEATANMVIEPGKRWELPEGAKAYLLDLLASQGLMLHVEYINLLYRSLHDLSETPRTSFGDSGRTLSGAALEVEIQPMVQKVKRKRRVWESVYHRRNALCLAYLERLGGVSLGGARRTRVNWPGILPSDSSAEIADQVSMVTNGLTSHKRAMMHLGDEDPDATLAEIAAEEDAALAREASHAASDAGSPVDGVEDGDQAKTEH